MNASTMKICAVLTLATVTLATGCSNPEEEKTSASTAAIGERPSATTDRTAFLTIPSWSSGFATVAHDYEEYVNIVCGPDYGVNYLVEVGETSETSVDILAVTVFYHPAADSFIVPSVLSVWSAGTDQVSFGEEVGQGRSEGAQHRFEINRRFDVGTNGAVVNFTTSGSFPTSIDTEGAVCTRIATIVVQPERSGY